MNTFNEKKTNIVELIQTQVESTKMKFCELEEWFDNVGDRLSERFTLHSRIVSFSVALVIAFAMQLDSIALLQNIYTDSELRARLVESTDVVLEQSNTILGRATVFNDAVDKLLVKMNKAKNEKIPTFYTRNEAIEWLKTTQSMEGIENEYNSILGSLVEQRLGTLKDDYVALRHQVEKLGLNILSTDYKEWSIKKFFGILISVILLSLGAPFWFNALQKVANLRGRLMQNEEGERTVRKQQAEIRKQGITTQY